MKLVKIINWILRIVLFILLIILIIGNLATTTFNFFGIYTITLPLIIILLIFMVAGFLCGLLFSFYKSLELKARINMLEKELKKSTSLLP